MRNGKLKAQLKAELVSELCNRTDQYDDPDKIFKTMASMNVGKVKFNTIERAIELAQLLRQEVASSRLPDHECIEDEHGGSSTTLGIRFDDKDASVTACMVGGPAFSSILVHPTDVLVAIEGQEVKGPEIADLLIGNDIPGSVVELTLKRASVWPCLFCFMVLIDV
jgi:hypothetical protein